MRQLGILFKADMVRAILDGRKSMTRRIINPQPKVITRQEDDPFRDSIMYPVYRSGPLKGKVFGGTLTPRDFADRYAPYQVGDLLYVKEAYYHGIEWDDCRPGEVDPLCGGNDLWYAAAGPPPTEGWGKKRSPLFMPKWAARLWLRVTEVKDPHRIQDISKEDAWAEGCPNPSPIDARDWFAELWDSINAKKGFGWDVNPWVFPSVFERIEK